ncbi:MAG: redoxin domain-containing protein [Acidimicrobiales bacterium]|nr:redoxin domain-containing protein [Acidimicrobiales bacterium]RZV47172.1 MAG: redoxin domain-containing protein [Acidimicrobiales bacterium]
MLEPGTPAPPFDLLDQAGESISLVDLEGRWIAMWWFPKASTPG